MNLKINSDLPSGPVALSGVSETMLWTLHNRALEAMRPFGVLRDSDCIRIYRAIDYDFEGHFGPGERSHPLRSRLFDEALRPWMASHPGGTVVELAAGLETQFRRCDDGQVRWVCVDLPEALAVRERFLPPGERCVHVAKSALELSWMDAVDGSRGVFISAQGLFMYFKEAEVRRLLTAIVERFEDVEVMFDAIPPWFSKKTLRGFQKTPAYRAPPMPWGIRKSAIAETLQSWSSRIRSVEVESYGVLKEGFSGWLFHTLTRLPPVGNRVPALVRVKARAG